ncbi:hypothetical protein RRG08_039862 [Elysia crispata]|uniref:Uncharacterized protein n=1 Tax=Elysia crispata TaxID=231223 RepID=A0AAE0ZV56_9GAST|nr:hypothetical protein RRG08_039862 [Elysia crispata]
MARPQDARQGHSLGVTFNSRHLSGKLDKSGGSPNLRALPSLQVHVCMWLCKPRSRKRQTPDSKSRPADSAPGSSRAQISIATRVKLERKTRRTQCRLLPLSLLTRHPGPVPCPDTTSALSPGHGEGGRGALRPERRG